MAAVVEILLNQTRMKYFEIWDSADKRVESWPLMSTAYHCVFWTLAYIGMVFLGPILMGDRKPFQLRLPLILYNMGMVFLNGYIALEVTLAALDAGYSWVCQPMSYSADRKEMRILSALWFFFFSKLLEFGDTVFLILRKKFSQLTFLHVWHHAVMFVFCWFGQRWVSGGPAFMVAILNSTVHTVMYAYYGLSAAFPNSNFWWKKYLTSLQLGQFVFGIIWTINVLRVGCQYPPMILYVFIFIVFSFVCLFINFWIHAYSTAEVKKRTAKILMNSCHQLDVNENTTEQNHFKTD